MAEAKNLNLKAVHEIHRDNPDANDKTPAKDLRLSHAPKTTFTASSQEEYDYLVGAGAAVPFDGEVEKASGVPSASKPVKPLAEMNKTELVDRAKSLELEVTDSDTKATLVEKISAKESESDAGDLV